MFETMKDWLGFGSQAMTGHADHKGHGHGGGGGHGHTHGTIDPTIATTEKGIWAIKWSFVILAITAALQLVVVFTSGSVALLADAIHNVGDAATAVPLWIAFKLVRRKPTVRFTYGLGRVEDLAGVSIVGIILISAFIAMYEAVSRLLHPQTIGFLWQVMVAGFIGFIGNETVAIFRIKVGRAIESAALIADGYHARTDGLTSLAVVAGAIGVWWGYPLADPLVGILITIAIFGIVWQSSKAIFVRLLDGVDPELTGKIRHATEHIADITGVTDVRARWLGHRLRAEVDVAVSPTTSLERADAIALELQAELTEHIPALSVAHVRVRPEGAPDVSTVSPAQGAHHAPAPVAVEGQIAVGTLLIIDTPDGERMQFTTAQAVTGLSATVVIDRNDSPEELALQVTPDDPKRFLSDVAPAEPHAFNALLILRRGGREENLPFRMIEPEGHAH